MSLFQERLTPPAPEIRSPREHYEIADRLLHELDNMPVHELSMPHADGKARLAMLHARLASCERAPQVIHVNNTTEGK